MAIKTQNDGGGTKSLELQQALDKLRDFVRDITTKILNEQGMTLMYSASLELLEKDWQDEVNLQKSSSETGNDHLRTSYRRIAASVSEKLTFLFKVDDLVQSGHQTAPAPYRNEDFQALLAFVTKWLSALNAEPVMWSKSELILREHIGFRAQLRAAVDLARNEKR